MTTLCMISAIVLLSPPITSAHLTAFITIVMLSAITLRQFATWHFIGYAGLIYLLSLDNLNMYDKISSMHIVLHLCAALYFLLCLFRRRSIAFIIVLGVLFGGIFLYRYPKFLLGIVGGASDFLRSVWFPTIKDLQSPLDSNFMNHLCFCVYGITIFVAIHDKICVLINKRAENLDIFWWLLIVVNMVYFAFACVVMRMVPISAVFSLPLILEFGLNGTATKLLQPKVAIVRVCTLILFPSIIRKYGGLTEAHQNDGDVIIGIK
ncbi:MAG: hypothetical protein LBG20_01175 [Holosporaceae bacterium]|nr:hypothetical protein [Holosporaceae bacterium]